VGHRGFRVGLVPAIDFPSFSEYVCTVMVRSIASPVLIAVINALWALFSMTLTQPRPALTFGQ